MNNCIGLRNMRSFVFFLFASYLLAIIMLCRVIDVFYLALAHGKIGPLQVWQILGIVISLLATIPLYAMMIRTDTEFSHRWIAFFVCIALNFGAIVFLIYPVSDFPVGISFGIVGIIDCLWLMIGSIMIKRYVFLIQRGWTEKEKVARKRARRRRYQNYDANDEEEDPMQKKLSCK